MVKIRILGFNPKYLEGEAEKGADVEDEESFRDWVPRFGKAFYHTSGAGGVGDVLVFAWIEEPGKWIPVADAIVLSSRRSNRKGWLDIRCESPRLFPGTVKPVKGSQGQRVIPISSARYASIMAQAYR